MEKGTAEVNQKLEEGIRILRVRHTFYPVLLWGRSVAGVILRPGKFLRIMEENLKKQLDYKPTKRQICWCYKDFLWFKIRFYGSIDDYFKSQMFRKSDFVRAESLSRYYRFPWRDSLQCRENWDIFVDKRLFYKEFEKYLGRKWMIIDGSVRENAYWNFLEKCGDTVVIKDPLGYGGRQVVVRTGMTRNEKEALLKQGRKTPLLIEEYLHQCNEIYAFSGTSVNTLRLITLIDKSGCAHVATAILRIGGAGAEVDNFSSGGMGARVDVKTGIVCAPAKNGVGREFLIHPVTGKQIVGYQIPDWNGYVAFAKELAMKFPGMRYVGWDIVKDINGNYCVIEGNKDAGSDLMEAPLMYGLIPYYEAILNRD